MIIFNKFYIKKKLDNTFHKSKLPLGEHPKKICIHVL